MFVQIYKIELNHQLAKMNMNQIEEETKFRQTLADFLLSNGLLNNTEVQFQFNPFKLYQLICRRGGYNAVINRQEWAQISQEVDGEPEDIKRFYRKFIYPYEQKNYFGNQVHEQDPVMVIGAPRKMVKLDGGLLMKSKPEDYSNLLSDITRTLEEQEQNKKLFYLKKSKLTITKAEIKKIILGLDAFMARKDVIYSLNMLLLYSVNSHHPFLFENHQKIFTALSNYTQSIYPPKIQVEMEDLRTITLIFRNLTMNPVNLKFMLGSQVFQLLVSMFNNGFDPECSKNIVDIMSGLVKVGWDCNQILIEINNAILQDKIEEVEGSIEQLRGLIDERDDNLAPSVTKNIRTLLRVLMSNEIQIQTKEQVFEILVFVSDISSQSREQLLKNDTLLRIIIGILQQMKSHQKLVQSAALTLSNMSSSATAKFHLKDYQSELMLIGFSDDSLAGIISNILAELSH